MMNEPVHRGIYRAANLVVYPAVRGAAGRIVNRLVEIAVEEPIDEAGTLELKWAMFWAGEGQLEPPHPGLALYLMEIPR